MATKMAANYGKYVSKAPNLPQKLYRVAQKHATILIRYFKIDFAG